MKQAMVVIDRIDSRAVAEKRFFGIRRSYSLHARQVNNAFIIVFAQYEKAFFELSKV